MSSFSLQRCLRQQCTTSVCRLAGEWPAQSGRHLWQELFGDTPFPHCISYLIEGRTSNCLTRYQINCIWSYSGRVLAFSAASGDVTNWTYQQDPWSPGEEVTTNHGKAGTPAWFCIRVRARLPQLLPLPPRHGVGQPMKILKTLKEKMWIPSWSPLGPASSL